MEMLFTINPRPHPSTYANMNVESFSSLPIPIQDRDPQQEEIDVVSVTDDVLPPGIDNDDSDGESEDFDFDNPSVPLPPPEPPDEEFDFESDFGIEISVVRNTIVKFECIDARVVFNDENDDLSYFMFIIFDKVFSFLSAESEDTIFDPGGHAFYEGEAIYKKTGRKLEFNGKELVGFDKNKVECFNCHKRGHFTKDCRSTKNSRNMSRDAGNARYGGRDNEEEATDFALMAFTSNPLSSSSSNSEETDSNDDNVFTPEPIPAKIDLMKADRMAKKSVLPTKVRKGTSHRESRPVWNNVQRINHQNKFAPTVVFTRSGRIPVSAANPKAATSTSAAKPVNTVGPKQSVNFSRTRSTFHKSHSLIRRSFYNAIIHLKRNSTERVNTAGSKVVSYVKGNRVTAVKTSPGCVWRPRVNAIDQLSKDNRWICTCVDYSHPQQALKNKGIVDSGFSRHMTRNKAYLTDYQEIHDGGFVAFGSSRGKITGKVTDDFSSFSWVFFLATKNETSKGSRGNIAMPELHNKIELQNQRIRLLLRDLVTKTHNKTPYELLNGRSHRLDFMRPFSCPVTILNTLDPLGKVKGKANEGFLDGYSVTSKAFREVSDQHYIVLPLWSSISSTYKSSDDKPADDKPKDDTGSKTVEEPVNKEDQAYRDELDRLISQEKEASDAADALRKEFEQGCMYQRGVTQAGSTNSFNADIQSVGVEADFNNMVSSAIVSPILTHKVNIDHPKDQILRDPKSAVQTRGMAKKSSGAHSLSEEGIFISQDKYVAEILKKFDFSFVKTDSTPIETQKPFMKDEVTPKLSHIQAVKRIFRKSTIGGCQFFGRRLISWQCKKHNIIATSTTEAEYVAATHCRGQQKQNMEDTMLELIEVCRQKEFYCVHDNVADLIESALNSILLSINLESQRLDKKKQEVKNVIEQPTKSGARIISPVDAITPVLPTEEPEYSLNMGYEHLSTIPETESDEVIESSAKNLLPIPSEYEVTFDDENEYDVPDKDESSSVFTTFSNPLFNDNEDFTSSDDESLSNEDVPIEEFKVYSNPLFDNDEINSDEIDPICFNVKSDFVESFSNHDTLIVSSPKFDFLEEFSGALLPTSIADEERIRREHAEYIRLMERLFTINPCPRLMDNSNMIVETLSTSSILIEDSDSQREGIDIFTDTDELLPLSIESDDYDSEKYINVLEELLVDDSISLSKNKSFYFYHQDDSLIPRSPSEPPDAKFDFEPNSGEVIAAVMNNIDELNEDECFVPRGEINVSTNIEDDDYFPFIFFIRIFLPYLIYPEVFPLLLSAKNEDTIFDPGFTPQMIEVSHVRLIVSVHKSFTSFV
nr:ribonuclease H-like domain-containing protein [Tanacetum cinerariifolium]